MHINTYNFLLTGTEFGYLNAYPRVIFYDGYLFTDPYGDASFSYTRDISGGTLLNSFDGGSIPTNDIVFWVDAGNRNTFTINSTGGVLSVNDISGNLSNKFIKIGTNGEVLTAFWPIYNNGTITTETEIKNNFEKVKTNVKTCFKFTSNSFLATSGFFLDFTEPFTLFMVWYDVNTELKTIPFSIKTKYNSITSEYVAYNRYNEEPAIVWGTRGTGSLNPSESPFGIRITPLSSVQLFNTPNITRFSSPGISFVENYQLRIDSNLLTPDGAYYHDYNIYDPFTTLGYSNESNNNFYLGEVILFKKSIDKALETNIINYLSRKWFLYKNFEDNCEFSEIELLSGGTLKNTYYEDITLKESVFYLPVQNCTTKLTIILSAFEVSMSQIKEVVCVYKDQHYNLKTPVNIDESKKEIYKTKEKIDVILEPDNLYHRSTYAVYLSVFNYDESVHKIKITGDILKCGMYDMFQDNYLIDSQLSSTSKNVYILNEDKLRKQLFVNILNIDTTEQILTGGDVQPLINNEYKEETVVTISLAELLGIVETPIETSYKRPVIYPTLISNINPVSPTNSIK